MRAVLARLLRAGCTKTSEKYCQLHAAEDPESCPVDAQVGGACTADPDCAGMADSPACDTGKQVCVPCVTNAHCANPLPVCQPDQTCGSCRAHTDCVSLVCETTGECAPEADVAYVDPSGGGAMCTKMMPCANIDAAEKKNRRIIKVNGGTIFDNLTTLQPVGRLDVYATPGAKMQRGQMGSVLEIRANGEVVIHDLEISGATGGNSAHGLVITQDNPKVTLDHVIIATNTGLGILASAGTLVMDGCVVTRNAAGGGNIQMTGYSITNSLFVVNGTPSSSSTGGLTLASSSASERFEFNTVAENSSLSTVPGRGVNCVTTANLSNSIFISGRPSPTCNVTSSLYETGVTPPTGGNITGDAAFEIEDPAMYTSPRYFRIKPASAARNMADAAATLATDIDGDARPQEGQRDIGADEFKP
jgi:hypothetical protein